jgi:Flp pilus assembly protein TadD
MPRFAPIAMVLGLGLSVLNPNLAPAQDRIGLAGSYLAARQAVVSGDHAQAATYFLRALEVDPTNQSLINNAVYALTALGRWDDAHALLDTSLTSDDGQELALLTRQVIRIGGGEFDEALAAIAAGEGAGPLVDGMVSGWLQLGLGNMGLAVEEFQQASNASPVASLAQYQLALARASVGDFEGADAIFSGEEFGPQQLSARGIAAHAQVLVQLDRVDDADTLLQFALVRSADPALLTLRDSILADPTRPYDFVLTPNQGIAEVFFSVARALGTDTGITLPLIYTQAAHYIDPGHVDALLLAAEILRDDEQFYLAVNAYAMVPIDHPLSVAAEQGRADALFSMGQEEAALEVIRSLARNNPDLATVQAGLGDTLRQMEEFEDAITAYDQALELVDQDQERYWFLFYARGISHERIGNLEVAEADFRRALALSPDQPQVLNYLGYSLVEQKRNLDEALDMIERAVLARPDSGYIVDSLGWVFYRLGRYEEAVAPMERAVELVPNDPIINDHLGDVYWKVGRVREAEFQWSRALSFEPEDVDAIRIRLKLDVGLDAVLEDEAASSESQ